MAKLTKEEFINSLNEMSILEIKELVDAMKEAYGVDPSAVAVAGPAVAAVEEGPSKVNVVLTAAGANKIAVIKLVRDLTGYSGRCPRGWGWKSSGRNSRASCHRLPSDSTGRYSGWFPYGSVPLPPARKWPAGV